MTVILRLQGLDVKAGTEDIRTFFEGLHIPGGGVYIVGGSLREAFIAFTTERDAQLALRNTGNFLKGSKVTLHVSCMAELEQKLKSRLKRKKPSPTHHTVRRTQTPPDANEPPLSSHSLNSKSRPNSPDANEPPLNAHALSSSPADMPQPLNLDISSIPPLDAHSLDSSTAFLLGLCTAIQGLQSSLQSNNKDAASGVGDAATDEDRTPKQTLDPRSGYVRLFGLPASTTKELICSFFKGLAVQDVIINVELGRSHVCLVKFANTQDACDALLFNQKSLGSICVEVRGATEKMWTSALQECETACDVGERVKLKQIPLGGTANKQNMSAPRFKHQSVHQMPFKPPKKPRLDSDSKTDFPTEEYVIKVNNIPQNMTKTDIKELFGCPNVAHTNIKHLLNEEGLRTKTTFLIFNCAADYEYAMNLSGCHVGSEAIVVSSITRKIMWDIMAQNRHGSLKQCQKRDSSPAQSPTTRPAAQTCLFVRNMPANTQKIHINRLFCKYKVRMDDITVLHDSDGRGIGEAVVQFKSQKLAALAQKLHGVNFMGTEVLLTRINVTQMKDILAKNIWGS